VLASQAEFQALESRTNIVQLAALHACFAATPFAGACNQWLQKRQAISRADYFHFLFGLRALRKEAGGVCWTQPEFLEPGAKP